MRNRRKFPMAAVIILSMIFLASFFAEFLSPYEINEMHVDEMNLAPGMDHFFGTDHMGRDLFSMVLYGGRASLMIGLWSTLISTAIAVVYGTASGMATERIDALLMRTVELWMSLPSILLIIFLQAMWGEATCLSLSVIIGVTGWMHMAKIVRSEVRQIGESDFILAARTMGGGFWYLLLRHILPNLFPSLMFMVVTNMGQAMITEATLSFLGLGLPLTAVSWGSLLSMSEEALLSNCWWLILIPGLILVITLICITEIGEYIRKKNHRLYSHL